jgi:DNA-binding response OmpR family regulator
MPHLLLVEDELHLAEGLRFNLEAEGFAVTHVETAEAALALLRPGHPFAAVLLDVMLPGMTGFQAVAQLRAAGQYLPVLMLTARGRAEDVLEGFAAGADDYLPKPFDLSILLARLNGLLRRKAWMQQPATPPGSDQLELNGRVIDFRNMELRHQGKTQPLTVMEANLLRYLVEHEGEVVPRSALLEHVWGVREDTDTRAVDNFVVRLRRYIEDHPARPQHLVTVRGVGYRFQRSS